MKIARVVTILLLAALLACTEEHREEAAASSTAEALADTVDLSPVENTAQLHGLKEEVLVLYLGEPDFTYLHTLHTGRSLPEEYDVIHNTYHPDDPETEGVQIRELQWYYDGYLDILFLHQVDDQWIVLESIRWEDCTEE